MKIEITHDSLAKRIYELIGAEDRKWLKIEQFIQDRYNYYVDEGGLLNEQDLEYIAPYLEKTEVSKEVSAFISKSKKTARKKKLKKRGVLFGTLFLIGITSLLFLRYVEKEGLRMKAQQEACIAGIAADAINAASYDQTLALQLATEAQNQFEIMRGLQQRGIPIPDTSTKNPAIAMLNQILFKTAQFPFYYRVLTDSIAQINDIDLSSDVKTIAYGSETGRVRLFDLKTGEFLKAFQAHKQPINDLDCIGKEGILTCAADGKGIYWLPKPDGNGYEKIIQVNHGASVINGKYLKHNQTVMTAGADGRVKIWDKNGNILQSFNPNGGRYLTALDMLTHDDNPFLITADSSGLVVLTDMSGRIKPTKTLAHEKAVKNMDYTKAGGRHLLAIGYEDGVLMIYEIDMVKGTPEMIQKVHFKAHTKAIDDLALSKDTRGDVIILTSSRDNSAKLWDEEGNLLKTFLGHNDGLRAISIETRDEDLLIVSGGEDETIKMWSVKPFEKKELKHKEEVTAVAFSPDGKSILTGTGGSNDGIIQLWDRSSLEVSDTLEGHSGNILSLEFSPDGKRFASVDSDGTTIVRDMASGNQILTLEGNSGLNNAVKFSPDGTKVMGISSDNSLVKMNLENGKTENLFDKFESRILDFDWSETDKLVVAFENHTARILDLNSDKIILLKGHSDEIHSVAFSHDNQLIISGSKDNTARIWNAENGRLINICRGHTSDITKVAFSQDNQTILTTSTDRTLRLWDSTGRELKSFISHKESVLSAAFSPDNNWVLTGSSDLSARLWQLSDIEDLINEIPKLSETKKKTFNIPCVED